MSETEYSPELVTSGDVTERLYALNLGGRIHMVAEPLFMAINALHLKAHGREIPSNKFGATLSTGAN